MMLIMWPITVWSAAGILNSGGNFKYGVMLQMEDCGLERPYIHQMSYLIEGVLSMRGSYLPHSTVVTLIAVCL